MVNIFEIFFNINVNCTDYMHKKCCETNYNLCCDIILHDIASYDIKIHIS